MTEKLIGALAQKIRKRFENEFEVYTESVYQNLEKPCFFVECESAEKVPLLGRRFFLRVWVKVKCEIDSERKNFEQQKILGDLFSMMNCVDVGDICLTGRKISSKTENGRVQIKGCYDIFFEDTDTEKAEPMEKIEGGCRIG